MSKPQNEIDVSIIIVNWNTCKITCDCLRSVFKQTADVGFEVIVVDNASSDDSIEMIKKKFPQIVLIANSENKGFAAANNQGMAIAKGKYVLLLNSDTIVLNHAIEKTVTFIEKHPEAGVVGCRIVNQDMSLQPTCFMYPSVLNMFLSSTYLYKVFPKSKFFGRERMSWWNREDVKEVDVVTGCFMLVRTEIIAQVGIMDERFFVYGEETDWCYRMNKAGWKNLFMPNANIIHLGGASSKQIRPEMMAQLRCSILTFMRKHRGRVSYLVSCLLVSLFFFFRVPFWAGRSLFDLRQRSRHLNTAKAYMLIGLKVLAGKDVLCFKKV